MATAKAAEADDVVGAEAVGLAAAVYQAAAAFNLAVRAANEGGLNVRCTAQDFSGPKQRPSVHIDAEVELHLPPPPKPAPAPKEGRSGGTRSGRQG